MSNFYRHLATFIWSHCSRLKFDANTERRFIRSLSLYIPPLSLSLSLSFYLSLILPLTHSLSSLACYTIPTFVSLSLSLTLFPIVSLFLFSLFLSLSLSLTHTHTFSSPLAHHLRHFHSERHFFIHLFSLELLHIQSRSSLQLSCHVRQGGAKLFSTAQRSSLSSARNKNNEIRSLLFLFLSFGSFPLIALKNNIQKLILMKKEFGSHVNVMFE